jgi:hypothetical protein
MRSARTGWNIGKNLLDPSQALVEVFVRAHRNDPAPVVLVTAMSCICRGV